MTKEKMTTEQLNYSDYVVREEKESKIDKGRILDVPIGFKCPQCKKLLPDLEHGEKMRCVCGLRMQKWGNLLECRA